MSKFILKDGFIVNENRIEKKSILIENEFITDIFDYQSIAEKLKGIEIIDVKGKYILPGIIDTHVHFRDPGFPSKADFESESKAAVAGGVTTVFDMPNTLPQTTNLQALNEKIKIIEKKSYVNFAFHIGATNDNLQFLMSNPKGVAGIKLFYASSTGNMLVNNKETVAKIFKNAKLPILIHSENQEIIDENLNKIKNIPEIPPKYHEIIRSADACFSATDFLVKLARKHGTQVHFLHISTEQETELFGKLKGNSRITAEVTANHLFFNSGDYDTLGNKIKCNPSIKSENHQNALLDGLKNNVFFTCGSDHAPHELDKKQKSYLEAPSGIPSIQHLANVFLDLVREGIIGIKQFVEISSHNPARLFGMDKRGFIKKGFYADLTVADFSQKTVVSKKNLHYKVKWTPYENHTFKNAIVMTFVNGKKVYDNGYFFDKNGRLLFN